MSLKQTSKNYTVNTINVLLTSFKNHYVTSTTTYKRQNRNTLSYNIKNKKITIITKSFFKVKVKKYKSETYRVRNYSEPELERKLKLYCLFYL